MSGTGASRRFPLHAGLAALVTALALVAAGCGDDGDETSAAETACEQVDAPGPVERDVKRPSANAPTASGVTFETNCGSFTITFDDRAPKTTASMESLVDQGFYDGLAFHRVADNLLIQGGDPAGDGTGGPGYSVDERPPSGLAYTRGTVAMAKTDAEPIGRSGSQFFVVVGADLGLTPDFALIGEVSEGMEVVDAIAALAPDGADGAPSDPVVIERATLVE